MSKKYRDLRDQKLAALALFVEKYPKAFFPKDSTETKPLAVGIRMALVRDNLDMEWVVIAAAIGHYTKKNRYLRALATCADRVNLDGSSAGKVEQEHRDFAITELVLREEQKVSNAA